MKVVTLLAQKGGAGKSTLAQNLAVAGHKKGIGTVIIDIDMQGSAREWGNRRGEKDPKVVKIITDEVGGSNTNLTAAIHSIRDQEGIAFIDTAARSNQAALQAASLSDLLIVPLRPSINDLSAFKTTYDLIKTANKPTMVVLNEVPPQGSIGLQAAEIVSKFDKVNLAAVTVGRRIAFEYSAQIGEGAVEYEPSGKAAEEILDLFTEVEKHLGVGTSKIKKNKRKAA